MTIADIPGITTPDETNFDKLDSKRFREIDWTLNWDEEKRGWYFNYHSFRPFLPEYADEWVEFRDLFDDKDQTIKYKAQCNHVKGELKQADDFSPTNYVLYKDAFGDGTRSKRGTIQCKSGNEAADN